MDISLLDVVMNRGCSARSESTARHYNPMAQQALASKANPESPNPDRADDVRGGDLRLRSKT